MQSHEVICLRGCMDPVAGAERMGVDVGDNADLGLVDGFCCLGVDGMLMRLWDRSSGWIEWIRAFGTVAYQ